VFKLTASLTSQLDKRRHRGDAFDGSGPDATVERVCDRVVCLRVCARRFERTKGRVSHARALSVGSGGSRRVAADGARRILQRSSRATQQHDSLQTHVVD
jgi:hypothetical protein